MKLNKRYKVLAMGLTIALTLGSMVGCSSNKTAENTTVGYQDIDAAKTEELVADQKNTLVIDVRGTEAYDKGHLEYAINIPFDEFESRLDELKGYEDQNIILICNTGNKSGKAGQILADNGFKKVYNAQDGMDEHKYATVTYDTLTGGEFEKMAAEDINAVIVDTRDAKDYEGSHIENAINIPIDEFEAKYNELDKDKDILIYCNSGRTSAQAANILTKNGYKHVYNSADGVKEFDFKLVK